MGSSLRKHEVYPYRSMAYRKIHRLVRGCLPIFSSMILAFRANFSARNFHVIYRGARTETEKALFPTVFLRNGTSRKKITSWCSWRGLKSCCCVYSTGMVERLQNDAGVMEHLGFVQLGMNA